MNTFENRALKVEAVSENHIFPKNRVYRIKWAKNNVGRNSIFLDECPFPLPNDSEVVRVWKTDHEESNPKFHVQAFASGVSGMVWGCIRLLEVEIFSLRTVCKFRLVQKKSKGKSN